MTYLAFLGRWYNLPWLVAVGAGVLAWLWSRRAAARATASRASSAPRAGFVSTGLVAAGVLGLTLNGAVHDFRSAADVGRWFPPVAVVSVVGGWLVARGVRRVRERWFPPLRGVTWNRPDLEGREAIVLAARLESGGETGRARHRDAEGVSHIVRVHLADGETDAVAFGAGVRLGPFDAERQSYPVRRA